MSDQNKTKEQLFAEIHQLREELAATGNDGNRNKSLLSDITYKTLVNQSPISTQILSPDGKTLHVNPAWEKLWGVPLEALANYNMLEDQQLIDRGIMPFIQKAFSGEAAETPLSLYDTAKEKNVSANNGKRWLSAVIYPVKDELDNVIEVILMHDDYTEQKQAEDDLKLTLDVMEESVQKRTADLYKSEKQFRLLIESSQDGIHAYDRETRFTLWNPTMERMSGLGAGDVIGKLAVEVFPFLEDVGEKESFREALDGKVSRRSIMPFDVPETGQKGWFESRHFPLVNAEGNVTGGMAIIRDVTGRIKADECLRKSEERFSLAMLGANDGLWDWNLETDEVYYSPRWKSMLGYEEEELKAMLDTWATLVHPDDKDWVLEKVQNYVEGRANSFEVEMRMRHKYGHEVVVLSRAFLVHRDSDAKPVRLVGTHVDITDRKKSEQLILKTSNILKMIATGEAAANIYDSIALLYESRHPGMRCSLLELKGNKLMHGGAPSLPKEYCDAVNGLENGPCVGSCGTSTYTGKRVLVKDIATDPKWTALKDIALPHGMRSCWSEPIRNSAGKVLGAFGMYYNHPALPNEEELSDLESAARLSGIIMERKRAEEEKALLTAELIIKNKELEQVLYVASHDLRSPLVNIEGYSKELDYSLKKIMSLIENANVPSSLKEEISLIAKDVIPESFHFIQISVEKMETLLQGLLTLSQLGRYNLTIEEIDMNEMMSDILDTHRYRLNKIITKTEVSILPNCKGDSSQINQVLSNILDNAIKYADSKRTSVINISGYKDNDQSVYCIEDNGVGIAPEHQEKIFEIFHQVEPDRVKGEGMGLTIAHRIIEKHNGKMWVESELGKGSKFFISLLKT